MIDLPACGSVAICPKCAALDAMLDTAFHRYPRPMVGGPERGTAPCAELVMRTPSEELEDFGEHLCRKCTRCGYGWVERTADAEEDEPEDAED